MASDIESTELLVLSSRASTKKEGSGWKSRVVLYHKGAEIVSCKLEVGEYWKADDGGTRFKPKGLTAKDLDALKPRWLEIMKLLRNPPAPPLPGSLPPSQGDQDDPGF
jgi:hypothetical protein